MAEVTAVAGKQAICVELRVGCDQEISDYAAFPLNTLHIPSKNFASEQLSLARGGHEN